MTFQKHITALDGLRGVAISIVFLHHYYNRTAHDPISILASLGWLGVDVFFVLSGFLITGILFDTLKKPHSLRTFFVRRSLRLFPIYFFMIGLLIILAKPLRIVFTGADVLFLAYGSNLCTALHLHVNFSPYLNFNHLWSLAVEEQFYLLWAPLVFLLAHRRRIMAACLVGILCACLFRTYGAFHLHSLVVYQNLPTRMDSLLSGALLALGIRGPNKASWLARPRLRILLLTGIALTCVAFILSHSLHGERRPVLLFGYFGNDLWCTALLALTLQEGTWFNSCMNHASFRFIGRYSYGLYLWHEIPAPYFSTWIPFLMLRIHPAWVGRMLGISSLFTFFLLVAIISYHAIELPFLKLKRSFSYTEDNSASPLLQEGS